MEDEYVDVVESAELIAPQTATNIIKKGNNSMANAVGVGVLVTALYSTVSWGVTTGLEWIKNKQVERKAHKDAERKAQKIIQERYDDKVETL